MLLPPFTVLAATGHDALWQATQRQPRLFRHIPKHKLTTTVREWVERANNMTIDNGGTLPSIGYLDTHGLHSLTEIMRIYPKAFEHITQDTSRPGLDHYVTQAEALVDKHGEIPCRRILINQGQHGLDRHIQKYPKAFAHLPQDWGGGTRLGDAVAKAESLAKQHGGKLPNCQWLIDHGLANVDRATRNSPDAFAHIPQWTLRKTVDDHVREAESIAKNYKGNLPAPSVLAKIDHQLYSVMLKNSKRFEHIPQKRLRKPLEESVKLAERLQKDNGGILPNTNQLRVAGHEAIVASMATYPEAFAHVRQIRQKRRGLNEWVETAKKLAKKHGGSIPNSAWLARNKYTGLRDAIRRHPRSFRHIKQLRLDSKRQPI